MVLVHWEIDFSVEVGLGGDCLAYHDSGLLSNHLAYDTVINESLNFQGELLTISVSLHGWFIILAVKEHIG